VLDRRIEIPTEQEASVFETLTMIEPISSHRRAAEARKKTSPARFTASDQLLFYLSILPPVLLGLLIFRYGVDLIDWDQWQVAPLFVKASHGSLSIGDLFAQQAEYRQFFPNLIFVGLGWLTHWNIKYEMMVSFLLGCLIAFNVYRLGQVTIKGTRSRRLLLTLIANLLIFSPAQFESWLLGEQIIYFIPVACLTTGLRLPYSRLKPPLQLMICILLATVSTFSSANGIVCWLVLAPVLFFASHSKRWKPWYFIVWVIGFILNISIYFHNFHKPSFTPSAAAVLYHPFRGLFFFCAFLGAPLATSNRLILLSAGIGAVLSVVFILCCLYLWTSNRELGRRLLCWLVLGAYSFISAVVVTIGRLGNGPNQALASRYVTFSVYLVVSLSYLVPIILQDLTRRGRLQYVARIPRLKYLAVAALIVLQLLNSAAAVRQMAWMKVRRLQAKACLLFINAVPNECLANGFPELDTLKARANAINDLGFLRPSLIKSNRITEIADNLNGGNQGTSGDFEKLIKSKDGVFIAVGWAGSTEHGEPANAVLLTYQKDQGDPLILNFADAYIRQPSVAEFFTTAPVSNWRWQKTISLDKVPVVPPFTISAWAFDATTSKAYKLNGTYLIESSSSYRGSEK